jgi:arylsulfatase A-like enzyme
MELMESYYIETNKPLYLSYLKYTNTIIKSLINSIISNDPKAIIVVMSDHGYRGYNNTKGFVKLQFNNICAIRTPDNIDIPCMEEWSTINLFPYLFNRSYGQNINYIKDRAVELGY